MHLEDVHFTKFLDVFVSQKFPATEFKVTYAHHCYGRRHTSHDCEHR